jgi:hypothetical protein
MYCVMGGMVCLSVIWMARHKFGSVTGGYRVEHWREVAVELLSELEGYLDGFEVLVRQMIRA